VTPVSASLKPLGPLSQFSSTYGRVELSRLKTAYNHGFLDADRYIDL
jgi:hypothetical protein